MAKYHFVQLRPNLYEFARRDIEDCDILAGPGHRSVEPLPVAGLRPAGDRGDQVSADALCLAVAVRRLERSRATARRIPRGAEFDLSVSRWGARAAAPRNPDQTERLRAYRSLDGIGVVNYRRIHALEERRLLKIDRQYDCRIGEFTLENFRIRQVFHTTVRPNWQGFNLLIRMILKAIGIADPVDPLTQSADSYLRIPQVPIHPKVAQDLGVKWADDATRVPRVRPADDMGSLYPPLYRALRMRTR